MWKYPKLYTIPGYRQRYVNFIMGLLILTLLPNPFQLLVYQCNGGKVDLINQLPVRLPPSDNDWGNLSDPTQDRFIRDFIIAWTEPIRNWKIYLSGTDIYFLKDSSFDIEQDVDNRCVTLRNRCNTLTMMSKIGLWHQRWGRK